MAKNIHNEYFDLYLEICNSGASGIQKTRESLNKKFPHLFDSKSCYNDPLLDRFLFRDKLVKIYAWAITDPQAIKAIVGATKDIGIVEIGAGRGYWASILTDCGVSVVAYDTGKDDGIGSYYPVGNAGAEVTSSHKDRALFLCWPPYGTSMAYDCVSQYKGNILIYIGEDEGGCNADDKFFDFVSDKFKLDGTIRMAQWEGLHDDLYIYKR